MKRPRKVSESEEEHLASDDEKSSNVDTDNDDVAESDQELTDNEQEAATDTEPEASDNEEGDGDNDNEKKSTEPSKSSEPPTKKRKRGIIYLSTIPKHMTVAIARDMFSQYAKIGRMFFQPETKASGADAPSKKKKKRFQVRHFAEGWVEFESKRAAKAVCAKLNGQLIATRKSSKFADILWSMKYLPRFKWVHLSERLTYEKAVHKQKMQAEVSQARKEAAFFQENLDRSDKNKRLKKQKARASKNGANK